MHLSNQLYTTLYESIESLALQQAILEEGSSDAAVQAAVNVLKKQRPELLR